MRFILLYAYYYFVLSHLRLFIFFFFFCTWISSSFQLDQREIYYKYKYIKCITLLYIDKITRNIN